MVTIEKNVPVPLKSVGRPRLYPIHEMEIGDSFLIAGGGRKELRTLYSSVASHAKRFKKKFTLRSLPEGVRCWRIA